MKKTMFSVAMATAFAVAGNAGALTLTPNDLAAQVDFGVANPYGWDWDQDAPIGTDAVGGAPGFSSSSWWSDVQGSANGGPRDYTALRINVQGMFDLDDPVTMADLEEISYWTYRASDTIDWQVKIYTAPINANSSWYGHRFNLDRANNATGSWAQNSTSTNTGVDWIFGSGDSLYPTNYSLADASSNYGLETIMFIDIIAGYATNSPAVDSYLDGVEITVGGQTVSLNLEANAPIPEPATMTLLGLGLGGLALRARKRKSA